MHSAKLLLALAAGLVSAQSRNPCKQDEFEITELNQNIPCKTIDNDVIVSESLSGELSIEGLEEIGGNLIITNATRLTGISSSSLTSIGKKLQLQDLTSVLSLRLSALENITDIEIINLPILRELAFGSSGVTQAEKIVISNTRLSDLSNLKLNTVKSFSINNNGQLKTFESDVVDIETEFIVEANGKDMEITLKKLKNAGELQLSNIKKFDAPALKEVGAIKLQTNEEIQDFKSPNLTTVADSVTIIDNKKLANVSFPQLTKIGDMTIQNNTAMDEIAGFPKLQFVTSAIKLYGDFEKVELPALKLVNGTVTVTSSTDIKEFCEFFDKAAEDDIILGKTTCSWDNPNANKQGSENEGTTNSDSNGSSGNGSDDDGEGAAGTVRASMAMLGLAFVAGLTQLL